ncbi:hypothetical protein B0A48_16727 [Cryoendolithus antarcticus]|uniref:Uncharacterized protein n=1 Tax=Cryoendolithus antarcticus TaxID=1507870 RepID=A0A1V8SDF8_9PEZI|nr:hypothetical protein B0A48_16727 [Cryoendolithus antarcticus]
MEPPVQGYIDPNFPNPMGDGDASIVIYGYTPSLALAALAVALFVVALAAHVYLLTRHKTWYFTTVAVGTAMEIIGYIPRILSSQKDPYRVAFFVIQVCPISDRSLEMDVNATQYFFIVVAPVLFSAAIYATLSIMIGVYGRQYAPMSPKLILWIFIVCDVVATIVQVAGAALVGSAYSNRKDPTKFNHILLAGLAFQVFSFAVFLAVLAWTLVKARKSPNKVSKSFIVALVVATLAVYLRTCFRLAETAEGLMKTLSTHEVYFGCLEFAPIVVAVFVFIWWHPGRWLKGAVPREAEKDAARGNMLQTAAV